MKKKSFIALGLVAIVAVSVAAGAYAASDIKLIINGKPVATSIEVVDGQSYVPLRVISESLGADVKWDESSRTIAINNSQGPTSTPSTTPSLDSAKPEEWQTYSNVRFGFSVSTPKKWTRGEESFNGDGTQLYIGNPDVEMSASASHYMPDIFNPYTEGQNSGLKLQLIKLDDGTEADLYMNKSKNTVIYKMFFVKNEAVYNFEATVSEGFFKNNEQTILKVIKSFSAPGPVY